MTLRTSIIAASAALALVVPAAASARAITNLNGGVYVSVNHGVHGLKSSTHKTKTSIHKVKSSQTKTSKPTIVTPRYIYVPVPASAPSTYVDPNECQDTGSNCTDEQLCEIWGENCGNPTMIQSTPADPSTAANPTGSPTT